MEEYPNSSLSLSTHSVLATDIGNVELGYEMFRKACLIDLSNDDPHSSDAGIHAASYGGLWQCVLYGFGGLRMLGGKLRIAPNLPKAWNKLNYTLLWKGQQLSVEVTHRYVKIENMTKTAAVEAEICGEVYSIDRQVTVHF